MPPAARLTDPHICPMVTALVPHVGGPIVSPGAPTVLIGGLPAARVTDMCVCVGPPDMIAKGSTGVYICGLPAARMGDKTAHGGVIVMGFPTVLIGDGGGGGGGSGGNAAGGEAQSVDLISSNPGMPRPAQQAQTLINAARDGTPFCERCAG